MGRNRVVVGVDITLKEHVTICLACVTVKACHDLIQVEGTSERAKGLLDLLHSNVFGLMGSRR